MAEKIRIDILMVEKGFAPSRTKAQDLINSGMVSVKTLDGQKVVPAPNFLVDAQRPPEIIIQQNALERYVSRAGLKMEGALAELKLDVEAFNVLDVGISTGGFTDCLLQRGARSVIGVDVGRNQLSPKLKSHPRVRLIEGLNAREIDKSSEVLSYIPHSGLDLIVIDVSFISLTLVLPSVLNLARAGTKVLALVKPQFEVGQENLDKNGIVRNENLYGHVKQKIENSILKIDGVDLQSQKYFESSLEGKDGNKEFFIFFQK